MAKDLMYLDYFNGFSSIPNANTLRLYKGTKFICAAPYYDNIGFNITNTYDEGSVSLVADLMAQYSKGYREGQGLLGNAMQLFSNATHILDNLFGANFSKVTNDPQYQKTMKNALSDSKKDVEMPWKDTKFYKNSKINIDIPTISFTIASSNSLHKYLNKYVSLVDEETNKNMHNKDEKSIKGAERDFSITSKIRKDYPLMDYCNYLIQTVGGQVVSPEKFKFGEGGVGIQYYSPTFRAENKIYNAVEKMLGGGGSNYLDNYTDGSFWISLGDENNSNCIYNLVAESLKIEPSKLITETGDIAYAKITIQLKQMKKLTTKMLENCFKKVSYTYGFDYDEKRDKATHTLERNDNNAGFVIGDGN